MRGATSVFLAACVLGVWAAVAESQAPRRGRGAQPSLPRCDRAIDCQKAANAAFDAEMARVGKDCATSSDQRQEDLCLADAADSTERNFEVFYRALGRIVGAERLRASEQAWLSYRKRQCDAIFEYWRPGTIAPSAEARCEISLTRSRMRDLDDLYEMPLHD